ncbi:hypothetical protein [Phycicoccus sp. Soil748]|uniref:hypothetical protein n=1 Tax=Intrasporangiaceae TaxID=85021 RepID=UPI000702484A|nr:hypothetical protein [Phycicoccus sp. Soil748]KRE58631.1 hypothetical protein ASG70_17830 [Phycicoccus sp. Soil748]
MGKKGKGKGGKGTKGGGHYLSPGVYIEEGPSGSRPIEAVGTSIAAFVGLSPFSPLRLVRTVALATALAVVVRRVR